MNKPKVIAFYLPQFHPTPDNDIWWGKGFTEWTNVGKAKPLFPGHEQPKVPADLGYYDLRLPEIREAQAQMAKDAGIYGFCYYHYWFGNGKEELELPFNEVLRLGEPDFPFMLCWANESWHKKFWNKDGEGTSKQLLVEQTYPGEEDHIEHFYRLLPAFKDSRYIKVAGKPVFMVYRPDQLPNADKFISLWNKLAEENGFKGIFFIGQKRADIEFKLDDKGTFNKLKSQGYNGLNIVRLIAVHEQKSKLSKAIYHGIRKLFKLPMIYRYKSMMKYAVKEIDKTEGIYPTIIPNWDHTPRSGVGGRVFIGSTPTLFERHVTNIIDITKDKSRSDNFVFLKSWNEWGEGNYIEPDLKYGKAYLDVLASKLK